MADQAPQKAAPDTSGLDLKKLSKDVTDRLQKARLFKARIAPDLREGYFFTNPRRSRQVTSQLTASTFLTPQDEAELMTTLGIECSEDFAGMLMSTFMPANVNWCRRGQGAIPTPKWNDIKAQVKAADDQVMASIRASNLETALYMGFDPDISLGTCGIWIEDDLIWKQPSALVIPIRKLELNIDAKGDVNDRFVVDAVRGDELQTLIPGIAIPAKLQKDITRSPSTTVQLVRGFWRDFSKPNDDCWISVIAVNDDVIFAERLNTRWAMQLQVVRFKPGPENPWGNGPGLEALPYLRVLDVLSETQQDRAEIAMAPPMGYPNDGIINFEEGIRPGMFYPMAPGSGRDFAELYFKGDVNLGMITIEGLEKAIRRKWYVDMPTQDGKTPPTASQWLDQVATVQKRVGLVGQKFWAEGPMSFFMRYKYILEQRGVVPTIPMPTGGLEPYNPAIKSQEWEAIQKATQLLSIAKGALGLDAQASIDGMKTFQNIKAKMGDELVEQRSEGDMKKMLQQMMPQAQFGQNTQDQTRSQGPGAFQGQA